MGKEEGEGQQQQPSAAAAEGGRRGGAGGGRCTGCRVAVRPQCVAALLLGAAVVLSALFWLPPFASRGGRAGPPDPSGPFAGQLVFRDLACLAFYCFLASRVLKSVPLYGRYGRLTRPVPSSINRLCAVVKAYLGIHSRAAKVGLLPKLINWIEFGELF